MDARTPADLERAHIRLASIREDISTRLWPVNAGMTSPDFNELMDQMALLQFNGEERVADEHRALDRHRGQSDRGALGYFLRHDP